MDSPEDSLIALQVEKEVTVLFKRFLEILEQLKLDPEKHDLVRKQVLDSGNDAIRQILQFLDYFDFVINKEKVHKIAQEKRISKRFVTSSPLIYNK